METFMPSSFRKGDNWTKKQLPVIFWGNRLFFYEVIMFRKVRVEEAIGRALAHDINEVDLEKNIKSVAFKKNHIIKPEDIEKLKLLGKENVFILDGEELEENIHEDDAALLLAPHIAGDNIYFDKIPSEGKINFYSKIDGLLKIEKDIVRQINRLKIPSLPTKHNNIPVKKDEIVAAFRIIPLYCEKSIIDNALSILFKGAISVKPYIIKKAGIIVTGNEVYYGRKEDAFTEKLINKLKQFNVEVIKNTILPDELNTISNTIAEYVKEIDILFITGGTSVDPDDCTKKAMKVAGVGIVQEGNPIQPGNNFSIGYIDNKPVCAVPAAALFYKATALDIFLPRLLSGEFVTEEEIAEYSIGGLCHFCKVCVYPVCPFGKGV